MTLSALTQALLALYNRGGSYTPEQLAAVYSQDIVFTDPAHSIHGLPALCAYLNHQYSNVTNCRFIATGEWATGEVTSSQKSGVACLFLQWDMQVRHPKLNGGRMITVNGLSQLQCRVQPDGNQRIAMHRDYFDLGQLLYENVPVLGALNRRLKKGMSS